MSDWLTGWAQPVPSVSTSGMGGMDHTGTGMMSNAESAHGKGGPGNIQSGLLGLTKLGARYVKSDPFGSGV